MAWRIHENVVRGEIDNRMRGRVSGRIWLAGCNDPMRLVLSGNCLRDLAGCLIQFENPSPTPGETTSLSTLQAGGVGDMTASRKVRVLDVPVEDAMTLAKQGLPIPEHMGNSLYLEWFSETNGRILIETVGYKLTVSAPEWTLSMEEEKEQVRENQEAIGEWFKQLGEASSEGPTPPGADEPPDECGT